MASAHIQQMQEQLDRCPAAAGLTVVNKTGGEAAARGYYLMRGELQVMRLGKSADAARSVLAHYLRELTDQAAGRSFVEASHPPERDADAAASAMIKPGDRVRHNDGADVGTVERVYMGSFELMAKVRVDGSRESAVWYVSNLTRLPVDPLDSASAADPLPAAALSVPATDDTASVGDSDHGVDAPSTFSSGDRVQRRDGARGTVVGVQHTFLGTLAMVLFDDGKHQRLDVRQLAHSADGGQPTDVPADDPAAVPMVQETDSAPGVPPDPRPFRVGDAVVLDGTKPGTVRAYRHADGKIGVFTISASGKGSTHYYDARRLTRSETASAADAGAALPLAEPAAAAEAEPAALSVPTTDDTASTDADADAEARPSVVDQAIISARRYTALAPNAGRVIETHVPHYVVTAAWHARYKEIALQNPQAIIVARIGDAALIAAPCFEFIAGYNFAAYERTSVGDAICWYTHHETMQADAAKFTGRDVLHYVEVGADAAAFVARYFPEPDYLPAHQWLAAHPGEPLPAHLAAKPLTAPAAAADEPAALVVPPASDTARALKPTPVHGDDIPPSMAWIFADDADADPPAAETAADELPADVRELMERSADGDEDARADLEQHFAARWAAFKAERGRADQAVSPAADTGQRRCRQCGRDLPASARADAKYCGDICRKRAHRLKGELKQQGRDLARAIRGFARHRTNDEVFEIARAALAEIAAAADETAAAFDLERSPLMG
jgi:hypothetical protein